ncbi:hypothetical protein [Mycolicibacterium fortuitum]|uniref:Uncharacterized protein n=2 Tax=Mycolicibacterium fortuitum TaxID=1766 RepID=A0AAE4VEG9_MYCFO|nr:hypothetical protein [Mycolicibacterium fortuitum]MCV7138376.1 hypothetical protein [Mycolicibacterium fortuitum]MDV7193673.1 hypothetical protein [Mycolicibacterium fortuitum]MDV7207082.1 hypothetical protein [Mycolicibacterium fortuitum]MDV7228593.1 hypothetical protein [Mycolicibacterium fortuitum]MDV7260643.1 hypothetical protein [Mycolicibacterium fortuitum]
MTDRRPDDHDDPPAGPEDADLTYAAVYAAARDLGCPEIEAMVYATEPDLFIADHPDVTFEH